MRVLRRTVRDQKRVLVGWGVGLALFCLLMLAYFPTIRENSEEFQQLLENYPPAVQAFFGDFTDFATGPGFLRAELFSLMFPILFLIYAIGRGGDLLAGEEERGQLDELLSHPVDRRRVVLEKAGGMALGLAVLGTVAWLLLAAGDAALGMGVGAARLAVAVLALLLLALAAGFLALAVGALRGRKATAVAAAAVFCVASYLVTSLGRLVADLDVLLPASLFHHYERAHGLGGAPSALALLALAGFAAAMLGLAAWAFERRDLGV